MRRTIIVPLCFLLLCVVTTALGCTSSSTQISPSQITTAKRGDFRIEVTASSNLALSEIQDLAFEVDGIVEKVFIEEGDPVIKGQILAQLDTFGSIVSYQPKNQKGNKSTESRTVAPWYTQKRNLEIAVIQAKIGLNNAIIDLENTKHPQGTNAVPDPLNVESKEYKLKVAEETLSNAQIELERFLETSPEIKAPFDGFVTQVNIAGGDIVSKGTVAVSVAAKDKFETTLLVSEMDIHQLQIGMPATVEVDIVNGSDFPAKITAISPTPTIQSGVVNYQVQVELLSSQVATPSPLHDDSYEVISKTSTQADSNQESSVVFQMTQLRDGLTATIRILVEEKKDVILVANRAIISEGRRKFVEVINSGSTERRQVTTGSSDAQVTEITEGLQDGEQVLIQQVQNVASPANMRISPRGDVRIR